MNLLISTIMRITRHRYRLLRAIPLTAGLLALAAPFALADSVYPPGWNVRTESVGPILFDFRPGCWSDSRRYWPEATSCLGPVPSRPISSAPPVIYQMQAGGERYHRAD